MCICKFFVLVHVSFFVINISLNMQTVLVLVSVVHFRLKNTDVANVCTRGNYEVANEDAR
jgi:hypothetical protein